MSVRGNTAAEQGRRGGLPRKAASGVATVLEIAKALKAGEPTDEINVRQPSRR